MMMKSGPTRLARAPHDLDREADPVLERSAPFSLAEVRLCRDELVDEVALGPHDLHAVVPRVARKQRAAHVVRDGLALAPGR